MNRRTFTKYLLAAPIALTTLLTTRPTSSVSPEKEKDEELGQKIKRFSESKGFGKNYVYYRGTPIYQNDELGQKEEEIKFGIPYYFDLEHQIWPYTLKNLKYI